MKVDTNSDEVNTFLVHVGNRIKNRLKSYGLFNESSCLDAKTYLVTTAQVNFKPVSYNKLRDVNKNLNNKPGLDCFSFNAILIKCVREQML